MWSVQHTAEPGTELVLSVSAASAFPLLTRKSQVPTQTASVVTVKTREELVFSAQSIYSHWFLMETSTKF